jgi:hypothetical protein
LPLLYPTGASMAGAAIGTVLMPGVGTGLGAKAGQAIENLFSGSKEEKKKRWGARRAAENQLSAID